MLFCVGSCHLIKPDNISTAVISPIELLKIKTPSLITIEYLDSETVKDSSVLTLQHSEPSSMLKHLNIFL